MCDYSKHDGSLANRAGEFSELAHVPCSEGNIHSCCIEMNYSCKPDDYDNLSPERCGNGNDACLIQHNTTCG